MVSAESILKLNQIVEAIGSVVLNLSSPPSHNWPQICDGVMNWEVCLALLKNNSNEFLHRSITAVEIFIHHTRNPAAIETVRSYRSNTTKDDQAVDLSANKVIAIIFY